MARKSSDSSAGTLLRTILGLIAALCILSAPYWLGTWIAVAMGAGLPSAERSILGWAFEIVALVVLSLATARWF